MDGVIFRVQGSPVGKARPRVVAGHAYTPKKTAAYEAAIRTAYRKAAPGRQPWPKGVPLCIWVVAFYGIPKSVSKKRRQAMLDGEIRPTVKPDVDNVGKIVADALNELAFSDDSQIVQMVIVKRYDVDPHLVVEIREAQCKIST